MTVEPARDVPVDASTFIPVQPGPPDHAGTAPVAQAAPAPPERRERYADPWHLHSQACYWDVRSCAWVCP
ncbi:MAG: hypothetical protein ACXVW6_00410 [Nocardioidaceae bacterium]